jgi:hypothetical protein
MSRSGERQYGDWEERACAAARPVRWRPFVMSGLAVMLAVALIVTALFGF